MRRRGIPAWKSCPLTDGTLAQAKPDRFYGARPEQLNRQIRNELCDYIIPSTQDDLPMVPNFFLEAKGPDGSLAVATQQACYEGALGARGMHALQSYQQDGSTYDNSAYTLTSTYHGGQLKLYTTHLSEPEDLGCHPEYIMTQLKGWSMTSDPGTFRHGASAYRNARDWAKEKRDEFIRAANERTQRPKLSLFIQPLSARRLPRQLSPWTTLIYRHCPTKQSIKTRNGASQIQPKEESLRFLVGTPRSRELAPLLKAIQRVTRLLDTRTDDK
ncbi:hypothetical protein ACJ73_01303 [Blastomyces percursus]|uniref:Uncharacterized protein n=1 Tax=Blastomyces percursus TaxID=1658174 RepID=A0A1J9QER7_9EURO|nr:hypothetical protein ACJ73_01303 [Blastomyces percursus]